ncbi:MAG: B12-binding domain-containing radical SAM protein [Acetobacteraceae bacterium]|nr:B12-binding domain-containing radical SAM protein [Acetobacteraceae bacterium]
MRIALISPRGVGMGREEDNRKTREIYETLHGIGTLEELMSCPNSPLLTIAAFADEYFDEVELIDEECRTVDFDRHYDLVAMSFMTQQATRAYQIGDEFRRRGVPVICGGMHPTAMPEETLFHADSVFLGEAEHTWPRFMEDFRRGEPRRLYSDPRPVDMTTVPLPRYDLLQIQDYRTIPVQISRGCPHDCEFCASTKIYGPRYRHKSVDQVVAEVEAIKRLRAHPYVYFTDDNMMVHRTFCKELLRALTPLGIRWITHCDVSIADDDELLELAFAAGCRRVVIGFESITPQSLRSLERWKYERLQGYAAAVEKIQSHGIGIWGTFIVGLDGDDRSVFQRVVDFARDTNLYAVMLAVPTPLPGSRLYRRLKAEGRILTEHWGSYTLWNVVIQPRRMTVEELEEGFRWTLRQIYAPEAVARRTQHFKEIYSRLMARR